MTEAPPEERFPILKEALESPSPRKRSVALKACDRALYTGPFHRVVGAEYQGLRREPNLWTPQSGQEILSALERVWNLLVQRLRSEELSSAEQREIALVLLRNVRHLVNQDSLRLTVRETLEHLVRAKYIDKKEALQTVLDILHYDVKDEEERKAWQELREEFTGTSFDDRLRRFVGTRYITDQFSEAGQQEDQKEKAIQRLVDESLEERANLVRNLSWLVTPEAEDAFRFGRDLGVRDPELNLWPLILSAQKTTGSSFLFIGAYLNGASVTQRDRVEAILDQLAADPAARPWVVELVWRVGPLLPQSIDRVLELVATGTVPVSALGILAYGSVVNELPPEAMERLIHFLLVLATPESAQIALNIYHMYLLARKEVIDPVLATGILGSPAWFEAVPPNQRQPHTDYAWAELAQALAQKDPDAAGDLAATFLDSIEEEGALSLGYGPSRIMGFLTAQLARDPGRLWPVIRKRLGPPLDTASFHFRQWLSGERFWETTPGAIRHIPKEWIWQWIDEDVGSRAWYFASFVPKDLLDEGPSLARELLERFGDREDVRRNLMANYFTEGWTGPESAHRSALLDRVQAAIDREQHPVVRKWLFDYNEALKKRFEKATVEEEREW